MISEIKGKISSTGSNLSDRLEDKLTGDFFGALRYLPFEQGLKGILEQVKFEEIHDQKNWSEFLEKQTGFNVDYEFWPQHIKGEIDLLLRFKDFLVGIEVKYISGISSEDNGEVMDYDNSLHQLSKYSHMIEQQANKRKAFLIFLAPFSIQHAVQQQLGIGYKISPDVSVGFVNWEDLHTGLVQMNRWAVTGTQQLILADAKDLLEVKGLKRFTGFNNSEFNGPIQHIPYIYRNEKVPTSSTWIWQDGNLDLKKEEQAYVYSTK